MILNIYVIHDAKAEAYMSPFFLGTDAVAIRGFSDAINNPESPFGRHPQDYTLFCIGEYSETKGEIEPCHARPIGNGVEFRTQTEL
mgnify:CR=1 FL=1